MEKIILILFHTVFGGAVVLLGGFIGYIFTMKFAGNHAFLPLLGCGIAAFISMAAYKYVYKVPRSRAIY